MLSYKKRILLIKSRKILVIQKELIYHDILR